MTTTRGILTLATVAVAGALTPAYIKSRDRHKEAEWAIMSALHNVAVSQIAYYSDNATYFRKLPDYGHDFETRGAHVTLDSVSDTGWAATATHPNTSLRCSTAVVRRGKKEEYVYPSGGQTIPMICK